jgi:hypothetical protein
VLGRQRVVGRPEYERQHQQEQQRGHHVVIADNVAAQHEDGEDRAQHEPERLRHADPAGHGRALADRDVIGDGGAQAGVLAVLECAEQDPEHGNAGHRLLVREHDQADGAEQRHRERPPVPPPAQAPEGIGVGGPALTCTDGSASASGTGCS